MTRARHLRLPLALAGAGALLLATATPAGAHIHADREAIQAGQPATVGFVVEHGCDDSPTTAMSLLLPEGSTAISGVDDEGFTSSVEGLEVTFVGGSIPDGVEHAFEVTFTPPDRPGEVSVKVVQTCEDGELAWIDEAGPDGAEPEYPAPTLTLTAGPPPSEGEGPGHGTDGHADEVSTTTSSATVPDVEDSATPTVPVGGEDEDDSGSSALPVAGGILVVLAVAGGGTYLLLRSRRTT